MSDSKNQTSLFYGARMFPRIALLNFEDNNRALKGKGRMMFNLRIMPLSLLVCVVISMGVSGCVKMNVIAQDGEKGIQEPSERTDKGFVGFTKEAELLIDVRTAAIIPPVSAAEVKTIFNAASDIVQSSTGPEDVECPVTFTLNNQVIDNNGMIERFDDAPQIIYQYDDIKTLNDKYNGVKVVMAILWCNADEFWPGFLGCTMDHGVVVVRAGDLEPVLAVHEANHVFGGVHRNESFAVMEEYIRETNTWLNARECASFR